MAETEKPDRKEPSEKPDERVEKLAVWLFTDVPTSHEPEILSWSGLSVRKRNDYREAAEKLLANYVSKEEHERIVAELKKEHRAECRGLMNPIGGAFR